MHQHGSHHVTHRTPPKPFGWGQRVKIHIFQNMVMLHIELMGMANAATCKRIFYPHMHSLPLGGDKSQNICPESSHVAYQINWNGA